MCKVHRYVPWYHYAPPASFYQQHQVHHSYIMSGLKKVIEFIKRSCGTTIPVRGQTLPVKPASKQHKRLATRWRDQKVKFVSFDECHDPLLIDISPSVKSCAQHFNEIAHQMCWF
ncbi:hypothetical protein MRX96_007589 [Rhipicephalus microplus]